MLLQVNTTGTTKTETLSLEGIPGGTAFLIPTARRAARCRRARSRAAPLDPALDRRCSRTRATARRDLRPRRRRTPTPRLHDRVHRADGPAVLTQPGFAGVDLTGKNATDRGHRRRQEVAHQDQRRPLLLHRDARRCSTAPTVYVVRTEERTYELAAALGRVRDRRRRADRRPEHAEPTRGRPDRLVRAVRRLLHRAQRRTRFEFFITAGGSVKALGPQRPRDRPADRRGRPAAAGEPGCDANAIPGVAGMLSPRARRRRSARGDAGISDIDELLLVRGDGQDHAQHDAARAGVQRARSRSSTCCRPTSRRRSRIFESTAEPDRRRRARPRQRRRGIYVQGTSRARSRCSTSLTLSGFLSFSADSPTAACGSRGARQRRDPVRRRGLRLARPAVPDRRAREHRRPRHAGAPGRRRDTRTCRQRRRCWSRSTRRAPTR